MSATISCHPSLPRDARVALSLKTVGGFSITEIARALLGSDAAIARCLVRAKRKLRDAGATFELPGGAELELRLTICSCSIQRPWSRSTAPWRCRRSPGRPAPSRPSPLSRAIRRWRTTYLLPAVKGRLLVEMGDRMRAAAAFRAALERPCSEPEWRWLVRRLTEVTEMTESTKEPE
jgi:predicted RNA polymerase sigma factor